MKSPMIPDKTMAMMRDIFADYVELRKVILFGSRATGRATERSDIDLVTFGITDRYEVAKISFALEDLPIPQICEIQPYERITHEPLKHHIDTHGIVIYSRDSEAAQQTPDQSAQAVT